MSTIEVPGARLYYEVRGSGPLLVMIPGSAGAAEFRKRAFAESDRQAMARVPTNQFTVANARYWFEHELRQYPAVALDLDALRAHADRVVLAVGRESRGYPCYEVNVALGKKLGRDVIELPGGHLGYVTKAAEYARALPLHLATPPGQPDPPRPAAGQAPDHQPATSLSSIPGRRSELT